MLDRWSTEVVKKAPNSITNSLALHATTVHVADRQAFSNLTLQFLSMDEQWYNILSTTKILLPGEELAIDTPIRATFPRHPPGHHPRVVHTSTSRQHIPMERTFANLPSGPPEQLVHTEERAVQALHGTQLNVLPLNDPFQSYHTNQFDVNASHWGVLPDFTTFQNPQPTVLDVPQFANEPDSSRTIIYSQPIFTSFGHPVSNQHLVPDQVGRSTSHLMEAFQLLPGSVQDRFADPNFVNNFTSWALNYSNRGRNNNGRKRKREWDWTSIEEHAWTDGEDNSGDEVPDSDDDEE